MTMTDIDNSKSTEKKSKIINIDSKSRRNAKKKIKSEAETKKKRDWIAAVCRGCRVGTFRVIEAVIVFLVITTVSALIGSTAIPLLAYEMSAGFGLTQGTNIYIAMASWILPMLFYTLLITAATFCIFKKFLKWIHGKFTCIINKPKMTEKETVQ